MTRWGTLFHSDPARLLTVTLLIVELAKTHTRSDDHFIEFLQSIS